MGARRACSAGARLEEAGVGRLMDRGFMERQRSAARGSHERAVTRRIEQRELWELEREKRLILEGKMRVDEAPYIAEHPVFVISKMTTAILEEKRQKVLEKTKPRPSKSLDYDQMWSGGAVGGGFGGVAGGGAAAAVGGGPESLGGLALDEEELERARRLWEIARQLEGEAGETLDREALDRVYYEEPLVKQLRTAETVAEMYRLADRIIGPIRVHVKHRKRYG